MTVNKIYGIGDDYISVAPDIGGVLVEIRGCGYCQSVLISDCDRMRVACALRAAEGFKVLDGGTCFLATSDSHSRLELSVYTSMTYQDMQYPLIQIIGSKDMAKLAELIDLVDPFASAKRRMNSNLRGVFG